MNTKPDTIKISVSHKEEIFADRVDLHVTVRGSSVVSGDQAMKKAKEVNQLVEALTSFGLSPEAIQLQGVRLETSSGALLKSSSATYRLKVQCEKLDQFAEVIDIIASQKNASLERVEWKYDEEAARDRGMEIALGKAKTKAEKVAKFLGVKLLGVYDLIENAYDEERPPMPFQAMEMGMKARAASEPSLGMEVQHSKTVHVSMEIWYRVSSF
jgi:uncharacterized protein YggE